MGLVIHAPMRQHLQKRPDVTTGRPSRLFLGAACILSVVLLTSCASSGTAASHATPKATAARTAQATATTGPAPVLTLLAAPPEQCAITPPPQQLTIGPNSNTLLVGSGAFWILGMYYPDTLHLRQYGSTEWPGTKMVVRVGPNYSQPVTLQLRDEHTGTLAWWTDGQNPPGSSTQTLILDPSTDTEDVGAVPGVPDIPHGGAPPWYEWGVFPIFEVAGCYELNVSWAGGSWQSVFAVGS